MIRNVAAVQILFLTGIKTLFMRSFGHVRAEMFSFTTQ